MAQIKVLDLCNFQALTELSCEDTEVVNGGSRIRYHINNHRAGKSKSVSIKALFGIYGGRFPSRGCIYRSRAIAASWSTSK